MIGSSIAVSISDIPFNGPIGGVSIGLVDNEIIINPDMEQRENSTMNITLAGTRDKVTMIEAGADEVSDSIMFDAIMKGHEEIQRIVAS